jgi:hypothetical protein
MFLNPSNQLLQIDTGVVTTYLYNPSQGIGVIPAYAGIGENQVLGQRYFGYATGTPTASNPNGSPGIYMLVQYLSTSATTLANWQAAGAPAPVYWTDQTYTTVSGIKSEGFAGAGNYSDTAGYWMPNTVSLPNATLAQLLGGQGLIQVGGPLAGAYGPQSGAALQAPIYGNAGAFQSQGSTVFFNGRPFAWQITAVASGLCNVLVNCDII